MKINSEQEMIDFGFNFAKKITTPTIIELIGDVGAGKTTFTRGLLKGLGFNGSVTSPSFTISKTYPLNDNKTLVHYDFYRLQDPGIMQEDLDESINDKNTITIVEWGDSVENVLPANRTKIYITLNDDDTREIKIEE